MSTFKLEAGSLFPKIEVEKLGGGTLVLGEPKGNYDWQLIVVYRGKHCPLCTNYLKELNEKLTELNNLNIDVIAVSADTEEKAQEQISEVSPGFEVGYGLTIEQMKKLGLYISHPVSEKETDRPFSEHGLFVVNSEGNAQIIDISNAPFVRPTLSSLVMGLGFIRNPDNNYPVRGTYS